MTRLHEHACGRIDETLSNLAGALRLLSEAQLRADREDLRRRCEGAIGTTTATLLLAIYDAQLASRETSARHELDRFADDGGVAS